MIVVDGLIFPEHVLEELAHDNITVDEAVTVIRDPDEDFEREEDGRTEYGWRVHDGRWVVIVVESDAVTVVSGWQDERRSRRSRRRRWS